MFHIAAFYKFVDFPDHADWQSVLRGLCRDHRVNGTVLLADEGINGTVAGPEEGLRALFDALRTDPRFEDLVVRYSTSEADPFLRLKVRLKREIVSLGVSEVDSEGETGVHVLPEQWNDFISRPDVIVIDARNHYESAIGTFQGAVDPRTRSFTDFPAWVETHLDPAERPRLAMFCTGGIRCEKATAWLRARGFDEVYQLEGGILNYLEVVPEEESLWEGECYVFDRRVSVGHGVVPGDLEVCPNCNAVVGESERGTVGYVIGVTCPDCHDTISEARLERFSERQRQIELAAERGERHLGRSSPSPAR